MVAEEVKVHSRSYQADAEGPVGYPGVEATKLKEPLTGQEGRESSLTQGRGQGVCPASKVESIIKQYSNFVPFPIELNGEVVNKMSAIWTRSKNEIKDEEYNEFYHYIGHDHEDPVTRLHFAVDAPLDIKSLLYLPAKNMEPWGWHAVKVKFTSTAEKC